MNFRYEALSRAGIVKNGDTQAPSVAAARQKVEQLGLEILNMSPSFRIKLKNKLLPNRVLKEFFADIGSLLEAGMTTNEALDVVKSTSTTTSVIKVADKIINNLSKGYSFAKSLQDTRLFPDLAINTVAVGERAGALNETLASLGVYYEEQDNFVSELVKKLVYPAILFVGVLIFLGITGFWILPRLAPFLENLTLPFATRVILKARSALQEYWYIAAGLLPVIVAGGFVASYLFRESQLVQSFYEKTRLGKILKEVLFSRLFLNLSTLHSNGVPLGEAVSLVAGNMSHYIAGRLEQTRGLLEKGLTFSDALARQKVFPTFIVQTIKKGEKAGQLEKYLQQISTFYLRRTKKNMDTLAQVVQPLLLVVLGGMVLFVAMSILVPIYGNLSSLGSQIK